MSAVPAPEEIDVEVDAPERVDLDVVWAFLSTEAYWGRGRTREEVERQVRGAWRVGGAYAGDAMVGFGRAVSDGVSFAYLADVFILGEHRGHGLGRRLIRAIVETPPSDAFRWLLFTADAHSLYAELGFAPPDDSLLVRPARPS